MVNVVTRELIKRDLITDQVFRNTWSYLKPKHVNPFILAKCNFAVIQWPNQGQRWHYNTYNKITCILYNTCILFFNLTNLVKLFSKTFWILMMLRKLFSEHFTSSQYIFNIFYSYNIFTSVILNFSVTRSFNIFIQWAK